MDGKGRSWNRRIKRGREEKKGTRDGTQGERAKIKNHLSLVWKPNTVEASYRRGHGKELRGVEGGKTIIRIYYVRKKSTFKKKENK